MDTRGLSQFMAAPGSDQAWDLPAGQRPLAESRLWVDEPLLGESATRSVSEGGLRLNRVTHLPLAPYQATDDAPLVSRRLNTLVVLELSPDTASLDGVLDAEAQISRQVLSDYLQGKATLVNPEVLFQVPLADAPPPAGRLGLGRQGSGRQAAGGPGPAREDLGREDPGRAGQSRADLRRPEPRRRVQPAACTTWG